MSAGLFASEVLSPWLVKQPPSSVQVCHPISSSYKDTSCLGLGPTLITSFILIASLKALSANSHILRSWGIKHQQMRCGGNNSAITKTEQDFAESLEDEPGQAGPPQSPSSLPCLLSPLLSEISSRWVLAGILTRSLR